MSTPATAYADIRSRFIADRVRETDWQHHGYIDDLLKLEKTIVTRGPHSLCESIVFTLMKNRWPVEYEALRIEHVEHREVSTDEFCRMKSANEQAEAREARARQEMERRRDEESRRAEAEAYRQWRSIGGRP